MRLIIPALITLALALTGCEKAAESGEAKATEATAPAEAAKTAHYVGGLAITGIVTLHVAAAAYHGTYIEKHLDETHKITCPVSFHFGVEDPVIPMDQSERAQLLHTMALSAIKQGDVETGKSLLRDAVDTHPQHFEEAARALRALDGGATN